MSSKTHIAILLTVGLFATPLQAISAGAITAEDSIAGLGAEIQLTGMTPSTRYTVTVLPPAGGDLPLSVTTDANGNAAMTLSPEETERAGRYRASVSNGPETTFEILPDSVDVRSSDIRSLQSRIEPDGYDEAEIAVTLRDRFGNALSGRPVTLVSSRTADQLYALAQETDASGVQRFVLSTREPGFAVVRAIDLLSGNTLTQTAQIQAGDSYAMGAYEPAPARQPTYGGKTFYSYAGQVSGDGFGIVDHFEIDAPAEMRAGVEAQQLTIRVVDRDGRTVESYLGTAEFSSTDPGADLPNFGSYAFKDRDLGVKTFALGLKFQLPGIQTLRVQDKNDPSIFGEMEITVTGAGGGSTNKNITITSHTTGEVIGSTNIVLEGIGPKFSNLIVKVMSGPESVDAAGSTDGQGNFSIPLELPATGKEAEYNILVREESGRGESEPLFLTLNANPPTIGLITFSPEKPFEGDQVLVVMQSDAGLKSATMTLADPKTGASQDITLNAVTGGTPPTYQGIFTAPARGNYQPVFKAQSRAGITAEIRSTFAVGAPGLPTVQNVRAEARATAVDLEWDQLSEQVDQYRIYVGESPDNLSLAVSGENGHPDVKEFDTQRPTGKATMVGLKPATTYFFAVTALQEGRESENLSNVAEAKTLGLDVTVKAQDGALFLEWVAPPKDMPLSEYILQAGTEDENYQVELRINGQLSKYVLRDLINGITYHLKLTPVTTTGDTLEELAAKASGTPNGDGFHAAASDPIPFDAMQPHDQTLHPGAPLIPSGIPLIPAWGVAAAALGGCGVYWRRRKAKRRTDAFLASIQSQYRG